MTAHIDRAYSIYETAKAYSSAAKLLNYQGPSPLLIPSMVNAALALELHFKSIYIIEHKNDFKINGKHSHDFHHLYNSLASETKKSIENEFNELINNRDMRDVDNLRKIPGITVSLDFKYNLKCWSNVFVKARYFFDKKDIPTSMMFFQEIEKVLVNAIRKYQPSW